MGLLSVRLTLSSQGMVFQQNLERFSPLSLGDLTETFWSTHAGVVSTRLSTTINLRCYTPLLNFN